jgi:uroporphyrinogen-III decarboxylase
MLFAQLRWQEVARSHYHRFCDYGTGLPDKWQVGVQFHNVTEQWFFGCPVHFREGQVPDTTPILTDDNKRSVFDVDIAHPLERDPYQRGIEFAHRMIDLAKSMEFRGRPVEVFPYIPQFSDGPLTCAMSLRGTDFLIDLVADEEFAQKLLAFVTEAAIIRSRAALAHWGKTATEVGTADDSIELLSAEMYVEKVLPHHRHYFDTLDPERKLRKGMHLCGDVARHLPIIKEQLGLRSFDTGFPIDFARVRRELGPDVEILGGVEVGILMHATPAQVYERAREILTSGILEGRKFILREANNLPPMTPEENLAAMYRAAFDFGRYS